MTAPLQGTVLFTDDVREEAGGKFSFMGLYGPEVWVKRGRPVNLMCTFLLWAIEPEVTIRGEFEIENAPEGTVPPPPILRTLRKDEDDLADRWMIHMIRRIVLPVAEEPVVFTAQFRVGDQLFSNRVLLDPEPETAPT